MKRDIAILRAAIEKLTPLLAGRGIKVTQVGMKAFVRPDNKGVPIQVNLPMLPDDADDGLLLAIQGFLDHEVGHILFTDFSVNKAAGDIGKEIHSLWNIMEDPRIEGEMRTRFPGSAFNIDVVHEFFLNHFTKPEIAKAAAAGDKKRMFGVMLVPVIRGWAGQGVFERFVEASGMKPFMDEQLAAVSPALRERIGLCDNSQNCLDCAIEMDRLLKAPPPPKSEPKPEPKSEPGEKGESGEGEEPDDEGSAGESTAETEPEKDEPEKDESESEDDSTAPSETDDDDDDDEAPEPEPELEDEPTEDDESEAPEPELEEQPAEDEPTEDNEGGTPEPKPESDDESADEPEDSEPSDGADSDEGGEGASSAAPDDEDASEDKGGEGDDDEEGATPNIYREISDSFEGIPASEFDDAVAEAIARSAIDAVSEGDYLPYSRDEDIIEKFKPEPYTGSGTHPTEQLDDATRHMVSTMQKDIERMMAARSQVVKVPGYRSGRLHSASLHRLVAGDDRVFRRIHENKSKAVAVTLLIDCSGSMGHGAKFKLAMLASYALSLTLERVGIKYEALGFTTKGIIGSRKDKGYSSASAERIMEEGKAVGVTFSRLERLYMPIFKAFEERLTPEVKNRFSLAEQQIRLQNNIDGESVLYAAGRLGQQREPRKVLLVLSDGAPAFLSYQHMAPSDHLKESIKKVEASGIETIGIGIEDASVRAYYPKYVVLKNAAELPTQVMKELHRILA